MDKNIKEIVFFVYKAGWWGCFDGLYRSLSKVETNKCYVIPIPYFEWQADGLSLDFSKRHYEAQLLPSDVPVTDYQKFKLEERIFDEIYIHNPYDGKSLSDSVEEEYYSEQLKKHTNLLSYVPHMLYLHELPESMRYLPVYTFADRILLAAESAVQIFTEIPREKLKVINTFMAEHIGKLKKNKPELSKQWNSVLNFRRNSEERLIILYHVSFSDLFYGNESMINKIEYIFNYIKERREVLFVWRAEPGIEGKLNELPRKIVEEFQRLKERFINEKIGIYDETEDEYLVSVLADVYMGEKHPLMNLFGLQGKPIILLDKECRCLLSDEELCAVSFLDCAVDGEFIWYTPNEYPIICRLNMLTGNSEVITEIPDAEGRGISYCGIVKDENWVYLNPHMADALVAYNSVTQETKKIYLKDSVGSNFDYIITHKEYLFLKAKKYPAIVRYNKSTDEYTYYTDWVEELDSYAMGEDAGEPYFLWGVVVYQEKIMLASSKANVIMEFDMDTGKHKFYKVGPYGSKFFGMERDEDNYWLIPYKGREIICWNNVSKTWKQYRTATDVQKGNNAPFRNIVKHKDMIIAFPCGTDKVLQIDPRNESFEELEFNLPYTEGTYETSYFQKAGTVYNFVKSIKPGELCGLAMYDNSIILMNPEQKDVKKIPCRVPLQYTKDYYKKQLIMDRELDKKNYAFSEKYSVKMLIDYCQEYMDLISEDEKAIYCSELYRG